MRLKNNFILLALIFSVCFLQAGNGHSARLSEGNKIASSPQKTETPDPSSTDEEYTKVTPQAGAGMEKGNKASGTLVSLNWDNVDISFLIKWISEITGKSFLVHNRVKANVTIIQPTKVTVDEAYEIFESVLEINEFTTVPSGNLIKIVPIKEATKKDLETSVGNTGVRAEDRVTTQIIPLKYATPSDLKKDLASFSSGMVPIDETGMLIVTDVKSNISHLLDIIKEIDIPGTGEEITRIPLKQASASTLATTLKAVFNATSSKGKKTSQTASQITIVPDERTNSLIVVASEVDTLNIRELVNELDQDTEGEGNINVYELQNADAEELAKTLNAIPKENKQAGQQGATSGLSKDTQITADTATNSLLITAKKDEYEIIKDVIEILDRPRSMVYIQSLVMEVSMKKAREIGLQFQAGKEGDSASVFTASNPGVDNFPSVDSDDSTVTFATGLTSGILGDTITIGGIDFADLGAVFRAYATDSDVQIKSNPQLLTLDNEEAELGVTDNVPYITRQDQTTSGTDYTNYDFKDVGVKLTITPQINKERYVRMEIGLEVSQISSTNEAGQPTTFTRTAKTTITIKDGQTVVIAGLIDSKDDRTNYRVPLLGRVPILGWLFRSKTSSQDKKTLYLFITPHVIENPAEADVIYETKKGHIETVKQGAAIRMHNDGKVPEDMRRAELGYRYLKLKDYEKALKYLRKALDKNPNNPYAILNIGYVYQMQGDKQKAIEMYEKLIAMDPPDRAAETTDSLQEGRKLTDMAKDNLKSLKADE